MVMIWLGTDCLVGDKVLILEIIVIVMMVWVFIPVGTLIRAKWRDVDYFNWIFSSLINGKVSEKKLETEANFVYRDSVGRREITRRLGHVDRTLIAPIIFGSRISWHFVEWLFHWDNYFNSDHWFNNSAEFIITRTVAWTVSNEEIFYPISWLCERIFSCSWERILLILHTWGYNL